MLVNVSLNGQRFWPSAGPSPTQASTTPHAAGTTKNQGRDTPRRRATSGPTIAITMGIEVMARISGPRSGKQAMSLSHGEVLAGANLTIVNATDAAVAALATPMANPRNIAHTGHHDADRACRVWTCGSRWSLMARTLPRYGRMG